MIPLAALLTAASLGVNLLGESARPDGGPEGLSGVTHVQGDTYLCVEDRGGRLHEATISVGPGGVSFKIKRTVVLKGRGDLEGCAFDPLTKSIWVSDEKDTSVRAFDPSTGREVVSLGIPEVYRKGVRRYRSLESLTISPDGLRLYTANEESLKGDATNVVRIQEFSRKGAKDAFRPSRQFFYAVDPAEGKAFGKSTFSGVSDLVAMPDGSLLVLEREFSVKMILPTFRIRIYRMVPGKEGKSLVWEIPSTFANYEGICLGQRTKDGLQTLVLVSDGGGGALENVTVLALSPSRP